LKERLELQQQTNEALFREHEITVNLGKENEQNLHEINLAEMMGRLSVGVQNDRLSYSNKSVTVNLLEDQIK